MDAPKIDEEYTVQDIYELPEGERAELIDGNWYDMAAPSRVHQEIVSYLTTEFNLYIRSKGGDCRVYPAPFAVFLNKDNKNYLEPDVSVVCDKDKLDEHGCNGAPDLVIEVTSSATKKRDYGIKLFKYRMSGVREYWIINPDTYTVNTFYFAHDEEDEVGDIISFDDEVESYIYPDLKISLAEFR